MNLLCSIGIHSWDFEGIDHKKGVYFGMCSFCNAEYEEAPGNRKKKKEKLKLCFWRRLFK